MRRHWRGATAVLVALPVLGVALGVFASPLLQVRRVVVHGPDRSLSSEVARQVRVPDGASILFYPLHRVTGDVRKSYRVESVAVRRASPNVLAVEVTARQPFAALDDGQGYTLVSREGILLYRVAEAPPGMPRLTGLTIPRAPLGTQIQAERWRWSREVLAGATKADLRDGLTLNLCNLHRITVRTGDGVTGVLGNVNNLTRKTVILGRVLDEVRRDGGQVLSVDVSTPETPLWKTG